MTAERHHRARQGVGAARPRRRGLPDRHEVAVRPQETPKPKYIACNADESEPGTFKDHVLMERNPHLLIEGCADRLLRDRREGRLHLHPRRVLPRAADARGRSTKAYAPGFSARTSSARASTATSYVHRGAGAYEAGEETALIESLEGKRAQPRIKPPFPGGRRSLQLPDRRQQRRDAVQRAAHRARTAPEWFAALGPEKNGGPKLFCVSGHVKRPGVYEASMDVTLRELIYDSRRRHARRPHAQGGHSRRIVGADPAARPARHPGELRRHRRRPARCSARPASSCMDETTCMVWLARTCCTSTSTSRAASARRAAKAATGCYKLLRSIERGEGQMRDIDLLLERRQQHRRQDAVRLRRRRGDAGADDDQAVPRTNSRRTSAKGRCTLPRRLARRRAMPVGGALTVDDCVHRLRSLIAQLGAHRSSSSTCCVHVGGGHGVDRAEGLRLHAAALRARTSSARRGCCSRSPTSSSCSSRRSCGRRRADKLLFTLAPILSATAAFAAFAVVPFGAETTLFGLLDRADAAAGRRRQRRRAGRSSRSPRWASTASCSPAGARTASTRCSAGCARRRR